MSLLPVHTNITNVNYVRVLLMTEGGSNVDTAPVCRGEARKGK